MGNRKVIPYTCGSYLQWCGSLHWATWRYIDMTFTPAVCCASMHIAKHNMILRQPQCLAESSGFQRFWGLCHDERAEKIRDEPYWSVFWWGIMEFPRFCSSVHLPINWEYTKVYSTSQNDGEATSYATSDELQEAKGLHTCGKSIVPAEYNLQLVGFPHCF